MTKVLGIGNALVDLLIRLEDDRMLEDLNLPKGSMTLVGEDTKDQIAEKSKHLNREMASGGSAANTIHGLARLGVETAFIGTVGRDETGEFFKNDLEKSHIHPMLNLSDTHSGLASTLITPDGERTFGTFLGASIELSAGDFTPEMFSGFGMLHVEGYLVQNHQLLESILKLAKEAGLKISIDLASYNVVEDNLNFLKEMIEKYVDIVFANEEEAKAFTGLDAEEALNRISDFTEVTIVKTGSKGSLVKSSGQITFVDSIKAKVVDTTGAGDLYAAGFLYGMIQGKDMKISGQIGSLLATEVIEVMGAKIPDERWGIILEEIKKL
ncbi:MAG: adenosine kinase [Chlorobi bacterium]|nr:adenosine kinase [Chlorobiota bacterium]